ncbi:hypothetical protein N7540_002159 [Penicillium herquei]|nr:hypothetical protein N7540_002159 [Penicillium herquei]
MFNICALVNGWQQSVSADGVTGLKATSLALSSATYITYLLTMILHAKSITGFIVTVIGWLASAAILFSIMGAEVRWHRQTQGETDVYTENFFAGVISASIYVLIAVLLSIYVVTLKVSMFHPADRQKIESTSVILRVTTFAILLLGGAAIYSAIEGWSLMDALYFTDYTLLTIGVGNLTPKTHLGRSVLFPYAVLGITSLAFLVSSVASFAYHMRELKLRWKIEEARNHIGTACSSEKTADGLPRVQGVRSQIASVKRSRRSSEEVLIIRHVKSTFYGRRKWVELGLFSAAWFVLWLASAVVFYHSEKGNNWTYFVALYFTYTSLTTIGYGDYFPTSNFGKVYFIFWSLLAIPILTNLVTAMGRVFHIWLVFCSSWIWRHLFRRRHPGEHHDHEYVRRPLDTSVLVATNKSPKPELRDSGLDIESQACEHLETRQDSSSAQHSYKRGDLSGEEQHRILPWRASTRTYYRLLLSEEIGNLISMTRVESLEHQEELCCTWSRVIPLLQAKGDAGTSTLSELTPLFSSTKSDHMTMEMLMNRKHDLLERNSEISWMLSLLVEELSSDLRKELPEMIDSTSI